MKEPDTFSLFLFLVGLGVATGVGRLFVSDEKPTVRRVIGRALTSTSLTMVSFMGTLWLPDMSTMEQVGIAALLASLGTSTIEALLAKWLGIHNPRGN